MLASAREKAKDGSLPPQREQLERESRQKAHFSREQRERRLRRSANGRHTHVAAVKSGAYEQRRAPAVPPRRDQHELRCLSLSRLARDNRGVADRVPRIRLRDELDRGPVPGPRHQLAFGLDPRVPRPSREYDDVPVPRHLARALDARGAHGMELVASPRRVAEHGNHPAGARHAPQSTHRGSANYACTAAAARSSSSISIFFICSIACHDALRLLRVRIAQQLGQSGRDDLPRDAEPVLQPAARTFFAALGELAPVRVDLFLVLAAHLERDRLVERVVGPAVQCDELLPVELEADRHHHSFGARPGRAVVRDVE